MSAGGIPNEPSHFKIIQSLAEQGLFQKNVLLIGSHAFLSICNALSIDSKGSYLRTTDIDFARPEGIEIGIPNDRSFQIDIPTVVKEFDKNFFLIPRLDNKEPSTSMQNNTLKIKIDFLTTESKDGRAFFYPDLGIAAEPLAYMGYLLGGDNFKGLVVGKYAIPVVLPDPARFAIHKLIVSEARSTVFRSKSIKDIQQSGVLLDFLIDEDTESVKEALEDSQSVGGAIKNIQKALPKLQKINSDAADFIKVCLDGNHGLKPF
ncbi:GSU2403 family nucleotidyltransferase fold protein (plasmid) [Methylomarinum sp. Ch1-1]|uniref:GSU2403 family nucleotidyltransferase fold protein n=1 Tax=Methylomarinum roseum TaxID=3067653 RepID=A0AAU7P0N1_9GAMM|nr:GSU2403 family nucleotidyltransferase fold protein [Methylomarinum sp. Ch1-1]MDP4518983.1 GSU2403 family nucleotidyltransferase fold protein [Methylomarinum sp. Ch1-1]MDP4523381.1 GSU2403 family nucleotidyltransferase fold protein [Methylomarinum sp. Ch1-1]